VPLVRGMKFVAVDNGGDEPVSRRRQP
jgi:hypothetical protein